ncbi:hypothetical protein AVEN_265145-1 [Araneus ventricosus]|uniref:Retrovirus-related Pol polyprotein from transposon TNT 1-94-like beta-barrel domain-containing protein n=1 Tax=Araneus ventricosus TaxID=182803 RepID=A0A4Y2MCJ5_ARAVE|nr:hypothetical protein AVEN_93911-1 [Araneus ventricosus]GBN24872.1 hypothetical protein AVEN_265145-1 [Araneus ventricosus]
MESMNFLIKPLDNTNYATWCSDIKVLLLERDCWDIVAEREAAPVVKGGDEIDARKLKEFNLRFNRAYTTIYMNASPQYRTIIEGLTNGAEAWKKLKIHCQPGSRARVMALKHEFFSTVIEPDENIGLYASKLSRIIEQLREAGHPVEDLDQCFQLMRYLPTEYENIIQTVYRWEDKDFKFPNVLEEILAEEARLRQRRSSSKETKFKRGNPKQPSRKKVSQDSVPNRHTSSEVRTNYLLEAVSSSEGGWILDSAATTHFCCDKDLFSKFEPVNNQTLVGAVDNITTPIKGKGTVHLKIGNVQIKLSNVAYAPELRKNLLSGPCFDKNGASFKGSKGKINVFHSNNELLFTVKLINGLYYVFPEYPCVSKCNVQNSKSVNIYGSILVPAVGLGDVTFPVVNVRKK